MKGLKARLSSAKNWLVEKWKAFLVEAESWIETYEKRMFLIFVGSIFIILILWLVPKWQTSSLRRSFSEADIRSKGRFELAKDLATAENNARVTLAQIIGGVVVLLGLYATFKNVKIAQDSHRVALDNLRVTEEGKLTERFSKAVELLGSDKLDVRLGGIYALERIARDSQKDHWTVMEVLTAFVREQSKKDHKQWLESLSDSGLIADVEIKIKKPPTDIQAALTVIGRRKWTEQEKPHQSIDLSESFLAGADLSGANLRGAFLNITNLLGAILGSADLTDANLTGAELSYAQLNGAKLIRANFILANIVFIFLSGADLTGAFLPGTNLDNAMFFEANLTDADLTGADLSNSSGLTWEQLSKAIIDETTKLPPELEERRNAEQGKKAANEKRTGGADYGES